MSREIVVSADVVRRQRDASNPLSSIWVSANAGSGKTHVLTERVLRLLLTGVAPEQILCLTYTKAAAAEMRKRVSGRLGEWALLDDEALRQKLTELQGRSPDAATILRARSLFAHALDTPGGLKIVTIHAFCESVLHRFPREAQVPFDFTVIEDFERSNLIEAAREAVIAGGLRGDAAAPAVETLFGLMSDFAITEAIGEALADMRTLRHVIADVPGAKRRLRKLLGIVRAVPPADITAEMSGGYLLSPDDHRRIFDLSPPDPVGSGFVDKLGRIDPDQPRDDDLREAYLTKDGAPRARHLLKAQAAALPDIAEKIAAEAERLVGLLSDLTAADLLARSEALLDVLAAISARYEADKRARSLLDFDDLIAALARLLEDAAQGPWVRYKLDSGITHILVDESQDTNPQQWRVVDALTEEFFDGAAAADRPRTVFAVGDQKQSIFSFQGAAPSIFVDTGRRYAFQARAVELAFAEVPLKTSFRTLPNILKAVDLVFDSDDMRESVLSDDKVEHNTARKHDGGTVTLWPPFQDVPEEADPDNWPLEAPRSLKSAARQVAERMADEIGNWIKDKRPLGPREKSVTANDILILVQTRGTLFQEVIRALVRKNLPTPGADRLAVTSHIGVLDLMALGDVLLNTTDDLQLAALLRSPLFDVSEDDLYGLSQPRSDGETLWAALSASMLPSAAEAFARLSRWRSKLDFDRPFEFYAEVLYADGGLKRFHARLGPEIDDVMSEFLDLALAHEQAELPSLQGFLVALRSRDVTIKRELAESGSGVRVMTVHGAKGLEAPIVILADATATERGRTGRSIYMPEAPVGPTLIHASKSAHHVSQSNDLKVVADAAQNAEYWRKLYVAMTRAEDELYITGALTQKGDKEGSWYEAIENALRPDAESTLDAEGNETAVIYPRERPPPLPIASEVAPSSDPKSFDLPPLPTPVTRRFVSPSSAHDEAPEADVLQTSAERLVASTDRETARLSGLALHALLQHLSRLDPAHWDRILDKSLPVLLPEYPELHAALGAKARSILSRPEFAELFGPTSRAEIPFLTKGTRNGAPVSITGRIDRLIVTPQKVIIVDYKSDAQPPISADDVPLRYITQLGLYALVAHQLFPGHAVKTGILWTSLESFMNLSSDQLAMAVAGFTIG